jgi:hypothetical protein
LAGAAVLAVAGYYPTRRVRGDEGVRAMVVAQTVVLAVVYATLLPAVRQMASTDPTRCLRAGLKVGTIRLIAACGVVGIAAWLEIAEPRALLIWAAIAYIVMIKIETLVLLKWIAQGETRK